MTELEINTVIAKALGREYHKPSKQQMDGGSYYQYEPSYTQDLNACHEMEKALSDDEWCIYSDRLLHNAPRMAGASALVRCECWLRTKGLWKD